MRFGLPEETIEKMNRVFARYPEIEEVWIYGSRAKGTHREGSDIDLTLFGEKITEAQRSQLFSELDDLNTPYLIDLSVFHALTSQSLIEHIKRVAKTFYKKKAAVELS